MKGKEEMMEMQIDTGAGSLLNKKEVRFDNLYDMLFDGAGIPKGEDSLSKKVVISGDRLDFLDHHPSGSNIKFVDTMKPVEVDKLKVSKQFKLVNPVPKF